MYLALNNLRRLICDKTQPTNQRDNPYFWMRLKSTFWLDFSAILCGIVVSELAK